MPLSLRRPQHEVRMEMTPLLDVIFLLLTFFIYAMVLMVRAELLPIQMQPLLSGRPAAVTPAVTLTIDRAGAIYYNLAPIDLDDVLPRLREARERDPDTVVYIAADATGETDRLPTFLSLYDRLALAGLDLRLVGSPLPAPGEPVEGP